MMDLIERYLAAIGRQLPSRQTADIQAELRDVLLSQVEEKQAGLGRTLTRSELETLLIDFGNPLAVAGRYRLTQHLIGPEVFPFWWAAVKIMLLFAAAGYVILTVLAIVTHKSQAELNRAAPHVTYAAVYFFGLITLVCAGIERFGKASVLQHWRPRDLPPTTGKPRSRFELAATIVWDLILIAWWLGLVRFGDFLPETGFIQVGLAPVWMAWRGPIIAYACLEIAISFIGIARPAWLRFNGYASIARSLVGIAILSAIVQAGHWLVVTGEGRLSGAQSTLQANFDLGMQIGIAVTIAAIVLRIALEAWRLHLLRQASQSELKSA